MRLPRLYAIIDRTPDSQTHDMMAFVRELLAGGVTLMQYRNKQGGAEQMLSEARELKRLAQKSVKQNVRIIMNDRPDICAGAGLDGVHLGQDDIGVEGARLLCPRPNIIGVSTHNLEQLEAADATSADYIAFGPVFVTNSKVNPDPVVGLSALREARGKTKKPLVAIGGITLESCRQALDAGADAVAVISALAREPRRAAEEFLRRMN